MKNIFLIISLFLILFFYQNLFSQDFIFFTDSDNQTFYDPSWLFANAPSELLRVNTNKFPVSVDTVFKGRNSLKLNWVSGTGGDWGAAVAAPGWPGRDITLKDTLSFWVLSNNLILSENLPVIYLEDLSNRKTVKINLSSYCGNITPASWLKISVPIQVFINNPGQADLTKIKTIFFGQGVANNLQHTLFIDEIRMTGGITSGYKFITVLGSSTAAGAGANPIDSAWVNKFRFNLNLLDTSYKVVNLAVGGYSTYDVMPSNFIPPAGRPLPKPFNNITYALEFNPRQIIVNLPSNDAANFYSISETISNFDTLISIAQRNNISIWIASAQPRNFSNQSQMNLLFALRDSTFTRYNNISIDFWNEIAQTNGFIQPQFNSGDGIHLNNFGHRILYERASNKLFPILLNLELAETDFLENFTLFQNFPNPFNSSTNISFYLSEDEKVSLKVYNVLGQELETIVDDFLSKGFYKYLFNAEDLSSAIYFYKLQTNNKTEIKKMVYLK